MGDWLPDLVSPSAFELARACQIAIGEMYAGAPALERIPDLFASVPRPISPGGAKAAAQTLFEFTARFTREHHRRCHGGVDPRRCKFDPSRHVVHVFVGGADWERMDVARIICDWLHRYAAGFAASHGPDIAAKARARWRDREANAARVAQMARDVGCSPATLWRHVTAMAGESPIRTRTRARVGEACVLLRTTTWKIDAIAAQVGWRSAKDLYRAFQSRLGLTPADVRRLSAAAAAALLTRLGAAPDVVNASGATQGSAICARAGDEPAATMVTTQALRRLH